MPEHNCLTAVQPDDEPKPFEFLIYPGTATAEEIAELFGKIEDVWRAFGGGRLEFRCSESRAIKDEQDAKNKA